MMSRDPFSSDIEAQVDTFPLRFANVKFSNEMGYKVLIVLLFPFPVQEFLFSLPVEINRDLSQF